MKRPTRKRASIVPIIIFGVIIYMINRDKFNKSDAEWQPSRGRNPYAKARDYEDGPAGMVLQLKDSLAQAQANRTELTTERYRFEQDLKDIEMNLREFKTAYKSTKDGASWPVPVRGETYSQDRLTSRVHALIEAKKEREQRLSIKDQQVQQAEKIVAGISSKLAELEQAREQEKLKDLSREAELWAQRKQTELPTPLPEAGPVRSLDELIKDREKTPMFAGNQALHFLDSDS